MHFAYLEGLRVVTMALNLPGPAACARLRAFGAKVTKVEPPAGDPMEQFSAAWYRRLHEGIAIRKIDLKSPEGSTAMHALLAGADLFITAQRHSALSRLGLDAKSLAVKHPRLCHVAISGHAPPDEDKPGHDLTYMAEAGALRPPGMPQTLFADMAGAERAVSTALALVIARNRTGQGASAIAPLADAAIALVQPLAYGLTAPGALLGGESPGYNVYATKAGWIAVAALEPHFAKRLASELGAAEFTVAALADCFARESAAHWVAWARERDLPIAALADSPSLESP